MSTTDMAISHLAFSQAQTNAGAQMEMAQIRLEVDKLALAILEQADQWGTEISPSVAADAALAQVQDEVPPPEPGVGVLVNKQA